MINEDISGWVKRELEGLQGSAIREADAGVGNCGLHIVQGSLQKGATAMGWRLGPLMTPQ